ncbi:MAG: DnaB-like helicase C-terminal domain-containing protein [Methylocella sp.]
MYQAQFQAVFKGCNVLFDQLFSLIAAFYNAYQEFLKPEALIARLDEDGQIKLVDYLSNLLTDPTIPIHTEEADFFAALEQEEVDFTLQQTFLTFRRAEAALGQPKESGLAGIVPPIDTMLLELHQLKARVQRAEMATDSLLFGSENVGAGHSLPEIYNRIEKCHDTADTVYFDLGITKFADILFKDGELVVFGGFTSHGKSILLRHMAYRQLYRYGQNVAFYSAEMSHDAIRGLFALMHANNKIEYPHTPYIPYSDWKAGTLTREQKDFLFYVADHDLRNNPKLGTLYLNQPNKSKFRLSDLQASLLALETTMPVHCCVVDYLTLLFPIESERGHPERTDYNNAPSLKNAVSSHLSKRV